MAKNTSGSSIGLLVAALALSGCGNKGPLYLPDEATTVEQPSPEDADADKKDKKKDNPANR